MSAYIQKKGFQINNLILYLKELKKKEETNLKFSWRKRIKIWAKINEMETKKIIEKKQWNLELSFWKDKIDNYLARLTKRKRERTKINEIINEKGDIIADTEIG